MRKAGSTKLNVMSKKCPYCDSYNTEVAVENYVGRGLIHAGRLVLAEGIAVVVGIFNPKAGHMAGHAVLHNTEPGKFKGYHCCNCGKDFSA